MKKIYIPNTYNYMGIFLTFSCNLNCSYCINNFNDKLTGRKVIAGKDWVRYLNRIEPRGGLPITLQGGEPSLHPDFYYIINNIKPELNIDILTNLQFDIGEFIGKVNPERVKREALYASIRISYHPETMNLDDTINRTLKMQDAGFSVGIWSVLHPYYKKHIKEAQEKCRDKGIDFRTKEFLGEYRGRLYGTYKYKNACAKHIRKKVLCKTTELIADSETNVFRCHHDLYKGMNPIGSLSLDDFEIENRYRECENFGYCNPCDIKVKTNRFQQYGHTSVDIKFGK